ESLADFLQDPLRGWGEAANDQNSPAYVEIAATPSATVTIRSGEETLGSVRWGELEQQGVLEPSARLRVELMDRGRNWVRTTVVDDATGLPIPCRVHFRSPEGVPYAPHGHHAHVNASNTANGTWHLDVGGDVRLGQTSYAYIDGRCEGWLPRGELVVDVARGFEYEPLRAAVTIAPGQQQLELRLRRWIDMNARGYYSGDTHVHFLSTQGGAFEAAGEDLNVVNLLLSQWGSLFTNTEEFTGAPHVSRDGHTIVYATQENRQHMLGHLTLLGLKEPVMPWCTGGLGEAELGSTLETTMAAWADACHAQGGTVILPHLPTPNGEPAALIATGRADAVEMLRHGMYMHQEYYRYLNGGYRLPLVGGTDKMTSEVPVGLYRTYVQVPADEGFSYESWCRNLRRGRTFLSSGPLLHFRIDGQEVGETLTLPGNGGTVDLEAWAESTLPIHTLQIVQQGRVVAATEQTAGARRLELRERLKIDRHTWLAARCGGPGYSKAIPHRDVWERGVMAHSSPVYVAVGEPWELFDPGAAAYMLTVISGTLTYIRERSPQYRPGAVTHPHGDDDHLAFLEAPFQEAVQAIHQRMHRRGIAH
ncbi:MAG TPA: CehA/McbA family metallohydrolase, partial [Chloroflexota bacterium]|nr:CehA/McbA family metallohydrolase [Chloroflexota bacterium]